MLKTVPAVLLIFLFLLIFVGPKQHDAKGKSAAQPRKGTLVFALSGEAGEGNMDAVAVVQGRKFSPPFPEEQKDAQTAFGKEFFKSGKTYRLIFGGGDAGTVTVKSWNEGCNNIHATVDVATSTRLGGQVRALATNSETIGKRASSRRAPTEVERAAVIKLVRNIYQQRRTPTNSLNSIKVTNLTVTDLDRDDKPEFIGSFTLASRNKFERDLFLIAKGDASSLRADFAKFQAYQPPAEGFLSDIDYIDQLDVDGDGIGEVFAIQGGSTPTLM